VTGGAGFIVSHLAAVLLRRGFQMPICTDLHRLRFFTVCGPRQRPALVVCKYTGILCADWST